MKDKEVKAKGSYGCVYEPALECADGRNKNDTNIVSKLLNKKEAVKELGEYRKIGNIDKKGEFHLPAPYTCEVSEKEYANMLKCAVLENDSNIGNGDERKRKQDIFKRYTLLIMENGGEDIKTFMKDNNDIYERWDEERCLRFMTAFTTIFQGIDTLRKANSSHFDVKPGNIVYNVKRNRFVFIDFGMTQTDKGYYKKALKDNAFPATAWYNYPLESEFVNIYDYYNLCTFKYDASLFSKEEKGESGKVSPSLLDVYENVIRPHIDDMDTFYEQVLMTTTNSVKAKAHHKELEKVILEYIKDHYIDRRQVRSNDTTFQKQHKEFVDLFLTKVDTYGVGITLETILYYIASNAPYLMPTPIYKELQELAEQMYNPDFVKRLDAHTALERYTDIIDKWSIRITGNPTKKEDQIEHDIYEEGKTKKKRKSRRCKYGERLENGKCPPKPKTVINKTRKLRRCKYGERLENGKCPPPPPHKKNPSPSP